MKEKDSCSIRQVVIGVIIVLTFLTPITQSSITIDGITGTPAGWTDDINLSNNTTIDERPNLAVSGDNIHIVWRNSFAGSSIIYRNSNDVGTTWNDRQVIIPNSLMLPANPDIGANSSNIQIVYQMWETGSWEINYVNSTDGGITWNPSKRISNDDSFNSEGPKVAVNNSNLHVIWVDSRHGAESVPPNTEIYYNRSLDGGITWQGEQRLTTALFASASLNIALNNSNIHVVWTDGRNGNWEVYYKMSKDNGVTWQDGQENVGLDRLLTTNATDHSEPAIAVNGSTIHVAWVDTLPGPVYYLYYRNSTDNGFSWNPIQLLSGPSPLINKPDISAWGNNIHLVWGDFRDDGSTREIYYKNSTDGGTSWNADLRLTYNESFDSIWPRIAINDSTVHVTWWDDRDGNDEIYYKRFPDFPTDSTPPTIVHAPVTESPINQPIDITVNVTDDFEVSNVTLYYENVRDTIYTAVEMTLSSGDWAATIPAQTETGLVHYFIWANDTSGNNITSPIMGDYSIQITGPPSIDVTNPIGGEDWTGGSIHQIEFTASDTEDSPAVLDVFLNYTTGAGDVFIAEVTGASSPYDWLLPKINATDVKINAMVIDSDGNKAYDDSPMFTIDSTPPEIISTNPVNNTTGISIFQPVVFQFNEAMNISSVIVNQTNGTDPGGWSWFWNEDKDTITGIHDAWLRGEDIEITVQENYSDDSDPGNVNNTAFVLSFTTEINPSPETIHTNISGPIELGDEIRINATITDDGEVMNAVLWWQDVDNNWHENYMDKNGDDWEYFIPGQMKEGTVRYQINATDDLQQKNTTIIYEFDIEDTISPEITYTPVESAVVNEPINITSQVTDLGGVDVVYLYYKNETDTDFMQVEMNPNFWYGISAYSLPTTIEYYIQAMDIYGNDATTNLYSLEILDPDTTPPEILLATPTGDDIPISTDISIVFSEAMNQTSVEEGITISPTLTGISYNWQDDQTLTIEISVNLSYNTTYTVTIDSGAKDLAGNTLASDYSWQFSTVEEPEIIDLPAPNDWGWIGIIILLVTIIMLMLLYQSNKERKERE